MENELQEQGIERERLIWQEYKTFVWEKNQEEDEKEEPIRCVQFNEEETFTGDSASTCDGFIEVVKTREKGYLQSLVGGLASNNTKDVADTTRRILEYILTVYDRYGNQLDFHRKESDYHGFLSGFLMNFRYRHTTGVYLELFAGRGYADIILLVRSVQRLKDSVPVIIELKAGKESADKALKQAENYVKRCPISSVAIHTSSEDAVCVGLNFDLDDNQRLQISTQGFLEKGLSLVKGLLELDKKSIRNCLLYPAFGIPAVPNGRIFSYTTRYAFASAAFAKKVVELSDGNERHITKYLFQYHDDDKMLKLQHRRVTSVKVGDRAVTMVLHTFSREGVIITILNICHILARYQFPKKAIDLSCVPNSRHARIYEVVCNLDPNRREEEDLGLTVDDVSKFDSLDFYLQNKENECFKGKLLQVGSVSNVHSAANVMMNDGWQSEGRHKELFQAISNVLFPPSRNRSLTWMVKNEAEFQAVLHGLFHICDNPSRVIIEFQLGGGGKLDLVLLQSVESEDTHPIGVELKFAETLENVKRKCEEADIQLERYLSRKGYKRVTDGNEVVLSYAVFDNGSRVPNTLIHISDVLKIKGPLEHSSMFDLPP